MKPTISVVMPVLNGERYIAEALESILAQACKDYELVVVNDGCTDRTLEILDQYRDKMDLRIVHHSTCRGIAVSVNDGIRNAWGKYITFLDHDDVWFPDILETHLAYMESHPDVGMVHADFQTIDSQGKVMESSVATCRDRKRPSGEVFRQLFMDSFIAGSSVMIRKECFDRLGGFDEQLYWGDYHMWLRIARCYKIDYIPKTLTKYRQHPSQSTRTLDGKRPEQESVAMGAINKLLETYPEIRKEIGEKTIRRRMAMLYFDMAYHWLWTGTPGKARACMGLAIRYWPTHVNYYFSYALSLLPLGGAMAIRRVWRRMRGDSSPEYRPA